LLYHCPDTRSFQALWTLEEVSIAYDPELLAFPPIFANRGYLETNLPGTVPLYIKGDVRLRESVTICDWLGRSHGPPDLAVEPDSAGRSAYLGTLFFGEASLNWPQGVCLLYDKFMPEHLRIPKVAEDMRKRSMRLLDDADTRLGRFDCFVSNRFTMADITGLHDRLSDRLKFYLERVRQHPANRNAKLRQSTGTGE